MQNGKNVSLDTEHTKNVITDLWNKAISSQKREIGEIGNYSSINKAIYYTKKTGRISAKMANAFANVFNVSYDYIIGKDIIPGLIKNIDFDESMLPSDEESIEQYQVLLRLQYLSKDQKKKEQIKKIKFLIQHLL